MDAFIYARVSHKDQLNTNSINLQVDSCKEYASKQGFKVVGIYKDMAVSGRSLKRSALRQMFKDATVIKPHIILVYEFSRISRRFLDAASIISDYAKLDIIIYSVRQLCYYSLDNEASSNFQATLFIALAEFESSQMSERVKQTLDSKKAKALKKNRTEFLIIEMREKGLTLREIASQLQYSKIKTIRGKTSWSATQVHRILKANNIK